jgi:hypothetical protein
LATKSRPATRYVETIRGRQAYDVDGSLLILGGGLAVLLVGAVGAAVSLSRL